MIDIIIPTMYGEGCMLINCLKSIKNYTTDDMLRYIVIVFNNNDDDITKERKNNEIIKISNELGIGKHVVGFRSDIGYAVAVNKGLEWLQARNTTDAEIDSWTILLNDDCILLNQKPNTWIEKLINVPDDCGIMGVKKLTECGYDFTPFFCVSLKNRMINEIGFLDTRFETGSMEDVDYCIRARDVGWKVGYVDDELAGKFPIWHKGENTVNNIPNWKEIYHLNQQKLVDKYKKTDINTNEGNTMNESKIEILMPTEPTKDIEIYPNMRGMQTWDKGLINPKLMDPKSRMNLMNPITIDTTHEEVKTIRLNLGCNEQLIDGWHNIEKYPKDAVADKVLKYDVSDLHMYADNSVDEILASHIIEHFTYWQAKDTVLKEWCRVLKPGGKISIETPDLFHTCKRFVDGSFNKFGLYGQFFAYALEPGQIHYFLYTEEQLAWTLDINGFTKMQRVFPDSIYAKNTPGFEDLFLKMIAFKK